MDEVFVEIRGMVRATDLTPNDKDFDQFAKAIQERLVKHGLDSFEKWLVGQLGDPIHVVDTAFLYEMLCNYWGNWLFRRVVKP